MKRQEKATGVLDAVLFVRLDTVAEADVPFTRRDAAATEATLPVRAGDRSATDVYGTRRHASLRDVEIPDSLPPEGWTASACGDCAPDDAKRAMASASGPRSEPWRGGRRPRPCNEPAEIR